MTKKKLLQTYGRARETDDRRRPSGGFISTDKPAFRTTGEAYIAKYANAEERAELAALAAKIEARRAKLPKFYYSICEKCGARGRVPFGDRDIQPDRTDYCLRCNSQEFLDGGKMREMTKKEAIQYDTDEATWNKKARERATKSAFFNTNQKRQERGLSPLSLAEFQAQEKLHWQQVVNPSKAFPKVAK